MTRFEENQMLIDDIITQVKNNSEGTYEEMMAFQMSIIASMLVDISKSLAIIADDLERKEKE